MAPSDWNSLWTIVGTFASIVGVIFSWRAWVQAKGAKQAAEEASDTVKARDTAHEFITLATDAKELLTAVQEQRADRAIEAANDLVHRLSVALSRRTKFLPNEQELKSTIKQLQNVSSYLSSKGFPQGPDEVTKLTRRCQQIHQVMCGIQGSLERTLEGVDQ
jgi:hypothetical protein